MNIWLYIDGIMNFIFDKDYDRDYDDYYEDGDEIIDSLVLQAFISLW